MTNTTTDLPRYQCHKQIWALKISAILHDEFGAVISADEGTGTGFSVRVDTAFIEKHKPAVGGYWVKYDDGYQSYSPAVAFEAGYTRMAAQTEPDVVINGYRLTPAQAMAVRVAISSFDPDCGGDETGQAMTTAYAARLVEVLAIMLRLIYTRIPSKGSERGTE